MPRNRSNFAPLLRATALYLSIGLLLTIAISWSLAAWMPQRNWELCRDHGWNSDGRGFMHIEQFETTGCARRLWKTNYGSGFSFMEHVIASPKRTAISRADDAGTRFPLGWPRWGNAESARQWFWDHRPAEWNGSMRTPKAPYPEFAFEHATGWPILTLWYQYVLTLDSEGGTKYGIVLPPPPPSADSMGTYNVRALPYHPIYPGLILNSIFWGAIAFALTRLALFLRATNRKRKNLCPTCAYDLRNNTTPGCPECGWNRSTTAHSPASPPAPQSGEI